MVSQFFFVSENKPERDSSGKGVIGFRAYIVFNDFQ